MRPLSDRDRLVHQFLPLAGALARRFHRRYHDLLEAGDALGVAQLELVRACGRVTDPTTAPAYLKRCIQGALAHWLRDRALLVRLPAAARSEATWKHQSLDQPLEGSGGSWLDALPTSQQASTATDDALEPGLEALVEQLPTAQAAALRLTVLEGLSLREAGRRLGISPMTVQRAQQKALASLREQVTA
ncbi:sigma-70 family RNA polymerase sigma factor [Synechococcus sp. BA-132 BA5]|uniref:sigma-70 family RNA polymerase sigma factor n=1 Tax=Synechococcus sp. BA-132 BA5 TaxID=3110252 RepID=UPI002B1EC9B0|nr:sigma-70 family RNA polymerase sigma factor [Synechococcus sp. BA-132 BA5]MEA5416209.1 sigma-70 family RNA polymerase sigma factor [Synechococcus sp. BA-132 BA5]